MKTLFLLVLCFIASIWAGAAGTGNAISSLPDVPVFTTAQNPSSNSNSSQNIISSEVRSSQLLSSSSKNTLPQSSNLASSSGSKK
jgi:hypothetical protein